MKINVQTPPEFKPVTITLETREELQAIYCLFNHKRINDNYLTRYGKFPDGVWEQLKNASPDGVAGYSDMFGQLEDLIRCKFMPS